MKGQRLSPPPPPEVVNGLRRQLWPLLPERLGPGDYIFEAGDRNQSGVPVTPLEKALISASDFVNKHGATPDEVYNVELCPHTREPFCTCSAHGEGEP